MRFKEWILQELKLDLSTPATKEPNPTQINRDTNNAAKDTMAKFGQDITSDMLKAPSQKAALTTATNFAQKGLKQTTANPAQTKTNVSSVAGKIYSMATGQEPKAL